MNKGMPKYLIIQIYGFDLIQHKIEMYALSLTNYECGIKVNGYNSVKQKKKKQ